MDYLLTEEQEEIIAYNLSFGISMEETLRCFNLGSSARVFNRM